VKLVTIEYDPIKAIKRNSDFKIKTKDYTNILYFFYKDDSCLYVGESMVSLYKRCFVNTPKEKDEPWFVKGNKVLIIQLDTINDKSLQMKKRHALEALFIVTNNPKYNKK